METCLSVSPLGTLLQSLRMLACLDCTPAEPDNAPVQRCAQRLGSARERARALSGDLWGFFRPLIRVCVTRSQGPQHRCSDASKAWSDEGGPCCLQEKLESFEAQIEELNARVRGLELQRSELACRNEVLQRVVSLRDDMQPSSSTGVCKPLPPQTPFPP